MNRKLLLALLLGSLLACATITRAEDAEVDDDDEEDDVEERAYLLVRRKGERPPVMGVVLAGAAKAPIPRICRLPSATRPGPVLRRQQPASRRFPPAPAAARRPHSDRRAAAAACLLPALQWLTSGRWRASRPASPSPSTMPATPSEPPVAAWLAAAAGSSVR